MASLHGPKVFQKVHAPELRGLAVLTTSMIKYKITRIRNDRVAVENTSLVQNEKEVDALKISKNITMFLHKVGWHATTDIP